MSRRLVFLGVCSAVMILGAERAAGIRCLVGPIELTTVPFDAIFTGTITDVRRVHVPGTGMVCSRWPDICQAAIATVTVGKTWKGQPGNIATIYSRAHVSHVDYGGDFKVGERMLFMLVRDTGETDADYRPAVCGDTMPEDDARKAGILDELDTLLAAPESIN